MSFNQKSKLVEVANVIFRDLRKNSKNAEKIFWRTVRDRKFEKRKFVRQHPLFHDMIGKESFFIADFYCHEERLIIELDGDYHKYKLMEAKQENRNS